MEARLRNLNYTAPIYLDFTVIENGIEREPERVHIGNFPIMVKSKRCLLYKENMDGQLIVSVPTASGQIPLIILMKALGMEKDEDIYNAVVSTPEMANIVYANIEECQNKKIYPPNGIFTRDDAINYLEKKFATG